MTTVVEAPTPAELAVTGADATFPVRRIYCIGKNYVAHIHEMNADERDPPVIFMKPRDAIVSGGGEIPYPVYTSNLHYEGELVVALKSGGYNISEDDAESHIFGYGVGLDMTRRDHQPGVLEKGLPWEVTKGFDQSCPVGEITPVETCGHVTDAVLQLRVNDTVKQDANVDLMIWKTREIIAKISEQHELKAGDIIMTGTPAGVGEVKTGDVIDLSVDGLSPLQVTIGKPAA
ncbi:fumarylacetoacetate hydrolase family protein [Sinisalibacter lacisalsi]|uniref:5-carboxymethyl-2-hydroxymuconate isomerase n=1 Tax=Sinisalibacter lacisalsi TaxID=1526570 RepID=A0ABQ1QHF4_9RHOB|nr:fumarylacetoacetate hydrolase family protein [Sinisalibacter lacisalsi]GGD27646.1 5-carboxymethyl-2-hydroxymuconate isomerase [Sinisalibacter lacisalsi]